MSPLRPYSCRAAAGAPARALLLVGRLALGLLLLMPASCVRTEPQGWALEASSAGSSTGRLEVLYPQPAGAGGGTTGGSSTGGSGSSGTSGVSCGGSVSLGAPTCYPLGLSPPAGVSPGFYSPNVYDLWIGDMDGDGELDLVVMLADYSQIAVLSGHGDGTFSAEQAYSAGPGGRYLSIGDLDGDGRPDVVTDVGGQMEPDGGSLVFAVMKGGLPLSPPVLYGAGQEAGLSTVIDLDHDGWPDVIAFGGRDVYFFKNRGDGTFQDAQLATSTPLTLMPSRAMVADVDHDGSPDLIGYGLGLWLLHSHGDGTFDWVEYSGQTLGSVDSLSLGDVTRDGIADVVFASGDQGESAIQTFPIQPDGTLGQPLRSYDDFFGERIALGDFDCDGLPDAMVVTNRYDGSRYFAHLGFARGKGDGSFYRPVRLFDLDFATTLQAVDLNRDGRLDLVSTGFRSVCVWMGQ